MFGADLVGLAQFVGDDSVRAVPGGRPTASTPTSAAPGRSRTARLSATVFRTGRPAREDHWENAHGPIAEILRGLGIRSSAASPIVLGGRTWGALLMHSRAARLPAGPSRGWPTSPSWSPPRSRTSMRGRRSAAWPTSRRRCGAWPRWPPARRPPRGLRRSVAEEIQRLLDVSVATSFRYEDDDTVTVVAAAGEPDALPPGRGRFPLDGDSLVTRVWRSGEPVRIDDFAQVSGTIGATRGTSGPLRRRRADRRRRPALGRRSWRCCGVPSRWRPTPRRASLQFTDLAATAIANMAARAELAASRARLVAAADDERRRVVRDLHDGAQQRLVHTVITLNLARQAVERNEHARALLGEAAAQAQRATAELRELAHGILPSVLSHNGLACGR